MPARWRIASVATAGPAPTTARARSADTGPPPASGQLGLRSQPSESFFASPGLLVQSAASRRGAGSPRDRLPVPLLYSAVAPSLGPGIAETRSGISSDLGPRIGPLARSHLAAVATPSFFRTFRATSLGPLIALRMLRDAGFVVVDGDQRPPDHAARWPASRPPVRLAPNDAECNEPFQGRPRLLRCARHAPSQTLAAHPNLTRCQPDAPPRRSPVVGA